MQQLQHTQFSMRNEMASAPMGYWFAPLSIVAGGNKDNSDIKRPCFKRCEA